MNWQVKFWIVMPLLIRNYKVTYQIEVKHCGQTVIKYESIESYSAGDAIDRIIQEHYPHLMLEYNGALVVIGYEFVARQLGMVLS